MISHNHLHPEKTYYLIEEGPWLQLERMVSVLNMLTCLTAGAPMQLDIKNEELASFIDLLRETFEPLRQLPCKRLNIIETV